MLRTNRCILSVVFFSAIVVAPMFCFADSPSASRDRIIQQRMDCLSHNLKNASVDWQNLCYVPEDAPQDQGSKTEAVNSQLDMMEDARTREPTPRRYTRSQVERQSATVMAKDVLNPDVSSKTESPMIPSRVETRRHTFDLGWEVGIIDTQNQIQ